MVRVDAAALRRLRTEQHLSLRALDARSGVGFDTIHRIEQGYQQPQAATVRKLAQALSVSASEFVMVPDKTATDKET